MIEVSIVINNYNYREFLFESISSCLDQDYDTSSCEVLLVDDGSTDGSVAYVREKFPSVRIHCQENQGQLAAIQAGLRLAQGQIILLLDADDRFYRNKVRQVVEEFKRSPAQVVYNGYQMVDPNQQPMGPASLPIVIKDPARWLTVSRAYGVPTSCISFRAEMIPKVLEADPKEFRICADMLINAVFSAQSQISYSANVLTVYFVHTGNRFVSRQGDIRSHEKYRRFHPLIQRYIYASTGIMILNPIFDGDALVGPRARTSYVFQFVLTVLSADIGWMATIKDMLKALYYIGGVSKIIRGAM